MTSDQTDIAPLHDSYGVTAPAGRGAEARPDRIVLVVVADQRDWHDWAESSWRARYPHNANRLDQLAVVVRPYANSDELVLFRRVLPGEGDAWRGHSPCEVIFTDKAVDCGTYALRATLGLLDLDRRWREGPVRQAMDLKPHPAKFHPNLLPVIQELLFYGHADPEARMSVLDPFAGVGTIFDLGDKDRRLKISAIELEPEWAGHHPDTICADFLEMDFGKLRYDAVATSPAYGNRMADIFDAKDDSRRIGYRFSLGRKPTEGSSCALQWGQAYRDFHLKAWIKVLRLLKPGGVFILNVKDHYRSRQLQPVSGWHIQTLMEMGFRLTHVVPVVTPSTRVGKNHKDRTDGEIVCRFEA